MTNRTFFIIFGKVDIFISLFFEKKYAEFLSVYANACKVFL